MDTYGRRVTLALPFETAVDELATALKTNGFVILGRNDVHTLLERVVGCPFRPYTLLEVAMPNVLLDALRDDPAVGAVLPTTIAVFEVAATETAVLVSEPFAALGSDAHWRRTHRQVALLSDMTCDRLGRVLMELEEAARTIVELRRMIG